MTGPLDDRDPVVTAVLRSPAGVFVVINRLRHLEPGQDTKGDERPLEVTEDVVSLEVAP